VTSNRRKILSLAGKLLVAVACLVLVSEHFDKDVFLQFLEHPSLFLIFVLMWIANQFLVSWRLDLLFSLVQTRIPYLSLVRATFISLLFTSVSPGTVGADVAKVVLIKNVNPDKRVSLIGSGIFLDRVIGLVTLIGISVVCSFFLPFSELTDAQMRVVQLVWLLGAGLIAGWLVAMAIQHWFVRFELGPKIPGYRFKIIRRGVEMVKLWKLSIREQIVVLAVSTIAVGIIALVQALVTGYLFEADGKPFNFLLSLFIFPALTVISALPITPLGLGVGQLAVGQAFKIFGLPAEIGVAVATLSQLTQALISLIGGGGLFYLNRSNPKPQPVLTAEEEQFV